MEMKSLLTLCLVLFIMKLGAQPLDSVHISGKKYENFSPYRNIYDGVCSVLHIGNGDESIYTDLFRLTHEGKIINLSSTDGVNFRLVQYFFAWKCSDPPSRTGELVTDSIVYDSSFTVCFYEQFAKNRLDTFWVPDTLGLDLRDGVSYSIDVKGAGEFNHRRYCQTQYLEAIDSSYLLVYEKQIRAIFKELDTEQEYGHFIAKHKLTCYNNGGFGVMISVPQKKERFWRLRNRKRD